MGGLPKVPVVAVNEKGEAVGYYESVSEAAQINGIYRRLVTESLRTGKPYKGFKWIREEEYRKLWFEGRTLELSFSCEKMRSEVAFKRWRNLTQQQRESRRKNLSEARKKLQQQRPEVMEPTRDAHRQPALCINTGECFRSVVELANAYGLNPSSVRACVSRGHKNKGYVIKYITKEEYEHLKKQKTEEQ